MQETLAVASLAYSGLGLMTGLFNGMFGIGGGVVLTPGLMAIFPLLKIPEAHAIHLAVGTSLAYILVTSSVTSILYTKRGFGLNKEKAILIAMSVVGSFFGSFVALRSPSGVLRALLGLLECGVGFQLLLTGPAKNIIGTFQESSKKKKGHIIGLGIIGWVGGVLSPLTGVGGGVVAVPAMILILKMPYLQAASGGAFMVIGSSLIATASFFLEGLRRGVGQGMGPHMTGFISPLALLSLLPFGILGARLGTRLAMSTNPAWLQAFLGGVMIPVGLWLLTPLLPQVLHFMEVI